MVLLSTFSHQTSLRLAEVAFLFMLIAGVWMAANEFLPGWHRFRTVVSGVLLAAAGVVLIVATHWGQFG
jgi:hypothetical protein